MAKVKLVGLVALPAALLHGFAELVAAKLTLIAALLVAGNRKKPERCCSYVGAGGSAVDVTGAA